MAIIPFTSLTVGTSTATGDVLAFVDISDASQAPSGTTKQITVANLFGTVPTPIVVTSTSTQLQLKYDGSNHVTVAVSSAGLVTLNATGASAAFSFSDVVYGYKGFGAGATTEVPINGTGAPASPNIWFGTVNSAITSTTDAFVGMLGDTQPLNPAAVNGSLLLAARNTANAEIVLATLNATTVRISSSAITVAATVTATLVNIGATTSKKYIELANTGNTGFYFGIESSVGGAFFTGSTAYASVLYSAGSNPIQMMVNSAKVLDVAATGLTITGTATTSAPTGGAGAWKLGIANAVSPTSPNRTVTIDIGGTTYYLAAKTTND